MDVPVRLGRDFFLDEPVPRHSSGQGYVTVTESSLIWKASAQAEVYTYQGLTTCTNLEDSWTIMSGTWNHLNKRWNGLQASLPHYIREERLYQEGIEAEGYRSPTWRVLRALQELQGAKTLQGESALTAPPFFAAAGRGQRIFWGSPHHEPTVYLWEGLDEDGSLAFR